MNEPNIAQDAQTLTEVLDRLDADGYTGQFRAEPGGRIHCFTCGCGFDANAGAIERMTRLEGASDPADMLAVMGVACAHCAARGTLLVNYGPESTAEEAEVLLALDDHRRGPGIA